MRTDTATLTFVVLPVLLAALLSWGAGVASRRSGQGPASRRRAVLVTAIGSATWMAGTWFAATTGVLRQWQATPPPFMLLVVAIVALAAAIAWTSYGRRLAIGVPLWALVAVQSFRLPLELAMHEMYERGVMPVQMSYEGLNYDVLTGSTAIVVATLVRVGSGGPRLVLAWNIFGLVLLFNVIIVAILSTPRFAFYGSDRLNEWVADPPYVWLPAVLVLAALAGHLLVFRALRLRRSPPVAQVS
jgi:hypothetical protein